MTYRNIPFKLLFIDAIMRTQQYNSVVGNDNPIFQTSELTKFNVSATNTWSVFMEAKGNCDSQTDSDDDIDRDGHNLDT
jgi:uncharacterized protein involved in high-affinity Fe2+ transport